MHKPASKAATAQKKFLVPVATAAETEGSAYFAARLARRSGAQVILLHVIEPSSYSHWRIVAKTAQKEASSIGRDLLDRFAAEISLELFAPPETLLREGDWADAIKDVIEKDHSVSLLVLGAASDAKGPGPLVSSLASRPLFFSKRTIPVIVVPGSINKEELRQLS